MADQDDSAVKSTQQLDLEARQAEDYQSPLARAKTVGPNEALVDNEEGFVGVDPIYQNYANDTEAPYQADEGAEKVLEDRVLGAAEEDAAQSEQLKADSEEQEQQAPAPALTPAPANEN